MLSLLYLLYFNLVTSIPLLPSAQWFETKRINGKNLPSSDTNDSFFFCFHPFKAARFLSQFYFLFRSMLSHCHAIRKIYKYAYIDFAVQFHVMDTVDYFHSKWYCCLFLWFVHGTAGVFCCCCARYYYSTHGKSELCFYLFLYFVWWWSKLKMRKQQKSNEWNKTSHIRLCVCKFGRGGKLFMWISRNNRLLCAKKKTWNESPWTFYSFRMISFPWTFFFILLFN